MKPEYRLHYAPDNASLVIRLVLEELGQPYETLLVDRRAEAQNSPEYRALNPNGLIPVLETPDGPLFETAQFTLDRTWRVVEFAAKTARDLPGLRWLLERRVIQFNPEKFKIGAEYIGDRG